MAENREDVRQLLDTAAGAEASLDSTIGANTRAAQDRSRIAKWIAGLYCVVVSLITIYLVVRGWWGGQDSFPDLIELMKIGVVPIVTLVIGYYFGSARTG